MVRVAKTGSKASKTKTRRANQAKGRKSGTTSPNNKRRRNAGRETEVARLKRELKEAQQQQTATADVLKVISRSAFDLQTVLNTVTESAVRLTDARQGVLFRLDEGLLHVAAYLNFEGTQRKLMLASYPMKPSNGTMSGRAILRGVATQIPDILVDPEYQSTEGKEAGFRSLLGVPLLRDGRPIGSIVIFRMVPGEFTDKQLALVQTFADQAVIAIENARLFNETKEALARQTATSDVLEVIASSPSDVTPVFEVIAERARALSGSRIGSAVRFDGELLHMIAFRGSSSEAEAAMHAAFPMKPGNGSLNARVIAGLVPLQIPDIELDPHYQLGDVAKKDDYRALLAVPMIHEGRAIGAIGVGRDEPGVFPDKTVSLLQTFASQAVIAIQNARLFSETKEALERQTATADILKVIASSPDDVQPVFEAIAERSNRIVDGRSTAVYSLIGDVLHLVAFTPTNPQADAALRGMFPRPLSWFRWGESISRGEVYQVPDMQMPSIPPEGRELAELRGFRAMMVVPLVSEQNIIGVISVTRVTPGKFADHHVQLLQTFADQAVIAISNVELFREVQQRTMDLSRSLDDLRAAQDRLVQTEKLASLGQLTAGIAHEIKNPLNFVNNFSALSAELTGELSDLLRDAALTDKMRADVEELTRLLRDNLEKVVQHGKRADSIVKNMLLHSREGSGEHLSADINALVEESLNLAYHGARAEKSGFNVMLTRDLDPDAGAVELYPQEITRALLNLISNGFYATAQRKSVEGETFEPVLIAASKNLGKTVEIRIRDNGIGIPPEVREKMFNPFFTTKPPGEGTGLGLSMTHDIIVKQHGGRIDVATEPGQFTEFTIVLPRQSNLSGTDRRET